MPIGSELMSFLVATGALALALACVLWGRRMSEKGRLLARLQYDRTLRVESNLSLVQSVVGAYPGVVLVWRIDDFNSAGEYLASPQVFGSSVALADLLKLNRHSDAGMAGDRLLDGLADLEARDDAGIDTRLRIRLTELATTGRPFSLTLIARDGRFLEVDGRSAGQQLILWIADTTSKEAIESSARGRMDEAQQIIARDPTAFLEMLGRAPFPAWRVYGDGRLQWVNQAYVDLVGAATHAEVIDGQLFLDDKTKAQTRRSIYEAAQNDDTHQLMIAGDQKAMRVLSFPLSGGVGAMAFDVTAQEKARENLDRHVRAHDEALNHVADAVAIFDGDGRLSFYNRAFADMWDMDEAFLLEMPTHSQLLDHLRGRRRLPARSDYADWKASELAHYSALQGVAEDEWHLPDNRTLRVTRQRHPMGGLLFLFRDITTELGLQTKYNAMIKTQGKTLDSLHEAVVVFGMDGRLKLWNEAFAVQWELFPDALRDEPDFDDISEACLPLFHNREVWSQIKGHITDPSSMARQPTTGEMRRANGSILTYVTKPLPDGNTLVAFVDISAQRSVEVALRERAEAFEAADRLKTEFVRNVSYQLRSPLQTILGYAEFLGLGQLGELNEDQKDRVNAIRDASQHLSDLIGNILDLAMIEAGRLDLDLGPVEMAGLVNDCVAMVVNSAADTEIEIKTQISDDVGIIRADETRIRQVLFNLVSNALRFAPRGSEVNISALRMGDTIRLSVRDQGRGIPAEQQATRFDSFTSGDQGGVGLGLALVKHFVRLHGGNVGIRSEDGDGTEIVCWLPVEPPVADNEGAVAA